MKRIFLVLIAVVCFGLSSVGAKAQGWSMNPFYRSDCIKVKPEKDVDFRGWEHEILHKYAQAQVDSGALTTWYLLRAVVPQGSTNQCDYVVVSVFPALPPKPLESEELTALLKKAGIGMTAEEYAKSRNAVSELADSAIFQTLDQVGSTQKGDYMVLYLFKTEDVDKWIAMEKKLWQPVAELFVKKGITRGWYANTRFVPEGPALPFDALTVDVYPSWDAFFKSETNPDFLALWKQVHPDWDIDLAFADYNKLITRVTRELWVVDDMVTK